MASTAHGLMNNLKRFVEADMVAFEHRVGKWKDDEATPGLLKSEASCLECKESVSLIVDTGLTTLQAHGLPVVKKCVGQTLSDEVCAEFNDRAAAIADAVGLGNTVDRIKNRVVDAAYRELRAMYLKHRGVKE